MSSRSDGWQHAAGESDGSEEEEEEEEEGRGLRGK